MIANAGLTNTVSPFIYFLIREPQLIEMHIYSEKVGEVAHGA